MQATPIKLPKKPRILQKEQPPDQRLFTVVPIRAATDRTLTPMELRTLMVLCSYANKGGLTWVGLAKVGQHLGVKINRASVLTRQLIAKNYVRVLYKGYAGERAQTRQIIYSSELSVQEIVANTGEKPPYMIQQESKQQQHKGATMSRKAKIKDNSVLPTSDSNLTERVSYDNKLYRAITEDQVLQLQRAVGADMLAHAISQCDANPTLEQVQSKLKELLA